MSSSSVETSRRSRKRRSSSRDPFLEKLRCLEEEYKRSRLRKAGRRKRSRSRQERRAARDDSDKENGERVADNIRRASHSRLIRKIPNSRRTHSMSESDEKSGERCLRETSRSSRGISSDRESLNSVCDPGNESGERSPREPSRSGPSPPETSGKQRTAEELEVSTALNESTLGLLGDDPSKFDQIGPDIHLAVADRWLKILRDGLPKEQKKDLQEKYPTIGNCRLTKAPKLNPEVKTAMSAMAIKKDAYQYLAQNQLGAGINAIGAALTEVLKAENSNEQTIDTSKFIERLADAGRILSDLHHDMSKTRKSFIVPGLNPIVKHIADESSIDTLLFGEKFAENLKAAKAMEKSSKDLLKQSSGYRKSFGTESREDNRRFQSSRSRQRGYPSQQPLNWRRPSGMSHRGTQRKGQKAREYRPKENRQRKD